MTDMYAEVGRWCREKFGDEFNGLDHEEDNYIVVLNRQEVKIPRKKFKQAKDFLKYFKRELRGRPELWL